MFTEFRLKILHFLKKNAKVIFIVVCVWAGIFFVNLLLKNYKPKMDLQTTYEPHTSVMDEKSSVPQKISNDVEEMLDKYVNYLLEGNVEQAFEMLSDSCKQYSFENSIDDFTSYALNKVGTAKRYVIQNYSNEGNTYIYQIKYMEDFLATGLTNTTYSFTEEKSQQTHIINFFIIPTNLFITYSTSSSVNLVCKGNVISLTNCAYAFG